MAMTIQPHMTNGHGMCHGGYIFLLADSAFAFACNSHGQRSVAQHCAVTFLAPGRLGSRLTAEAVERQRADRSGITDVTVREIDELKRDVAKGAAHPMKLKQELGIRIVRDFHGHEAAEHSAQDWSRMFQKDETPEDLPLVTLKLADVLAPNAATSADGMVQVRLDKLLAAAGLATSVSDGSRKVKQNAVKIGGELKNDLVASVKLGSEFTLRAGKKMVRLNMEE